MNQRKPQIISALLVLISLMAVGYWSVTAWATGLPQEQVSAPPLQDDYTVHGSTIIPCTPLDDVSITGSTQGLIGATYTFTATGYHDYFIL